MNTEGNATDGDMDTKRRSEKQTFSRRGALKSAATGLGLIPFLGIGRTDDTVKYVRQVGKNKVAYRTVPREWYEYEFDQVENAVANARKKYKDLPEVQGISRIRDPQNTIQSLNTSRIKISVNSVDTISSTTLDGVPIYTEEANTLVQLKDPYCEFNDDYDTWGGGVEIGAMDEGEIYAGTSCSRVYDYDASDWRILTANHLFGSGDYNNGKVITQPAEGSTAGVVQKYNTFEDWALVDLSYDDNISETIRISNQENMDLAGYVTKEECVYLMNNPEPGETSITKQGRTSGNMNGYITEVDASINDGLITHNHYIATSCNGGEGDSGGPIFQECDWYEGKACVIAMTTHTEDSVGFDYMCDYPTPIMANAGGIAAYHLENNHNIGFF